MKKIIKYTLIDTINRDITEYNKNKFVNTLYFEQDKDNENYGNLYCGDVLLYWGNLKEINAIIKAMFKLREA